MIAPDDLYNHSFNPRYLKLDGFSVVESCFHNQFSDGEMLTTEHLILFVLKGYYIVFFGDERFEIARGEGIIIPKNHYFKYQKKHERLEQYHGIMFFLKETIIKKFLSINTLVKVAEISKSPIKKISINPFINVFIGSISFFFNQNASSNDNFLINKLFELLFIISDTDPSILSQLKAFSTSDISDFMTIVETNYRHNIKLQKLAHMSGKSLSTFKKDFKKVFNTTPHQWILSKKLAFAKILIENGNKKMSDVCFEAGFESVSHFSRVFKTKYGYPPSSLKKPNFLVK
jgi:AraC-like DNA-binding protein